MILSSKLSLKFATPSKTAKIVAVLDRYRACVNAYIRHIWEHGGTLDKATADAVPPGHLSIRMRAHALQQALGIVAATRASARKLKVEPSRPHFHGAMILSKQLAEVSNAASSSEFDLWLRFSTLRKGKRINAPLKATRHLRKLLSYPGAQLKGGCSIGERCGRYWATVWVELPEPLSKRHGTHVGIDVGMNKLVAVSDGTFHGEDLKEILQKVRRRKPGSKGRRRAAVERRQYINHTLNQLPWDDWSLVAVEKLKNLKKGKKKNRNKRFRKALAPWTYAYVMERIELKARLNRVQRVEVNPRYTSQICPQCTHRAKSNRSNEKFSCVRCGYSADADFVGSVNILNRATGERMVPQPCSGS